MSSEPIQIPRNWGSVAPDAILQVMKSLTRVGSKGRGEMSMAPLTYPKWDKLSHSQQEKIVKIFSEQPNDVQLRLVQTAVEDSAAGRKPRISVIKRKLAEIKSGHLQAKAMRAAGDLGVAVNKPMIFTGEAAGQSHVPLTLANLSVPKPSSESVKIEALAGLIAHSKSASIRAAAERELCRLAGIPFCETI